MSAWGVVCLGGCLPGGGSLLRGGGLPRRVSAQGGVHNPFVNRMTDRCKNIIFPQLRLLTVI